MNSIIGYSVFLSCLVSLYIMVVSQVDMYTTISYENGMPRINQFKMNIVTNILTFIMIVLNTFVADYQNHFICRDVFVAGSTRVLLQRILYCTSVLILMTFAYQYTCSINNYQNFFVEWAYILLYAHSDITSTDIYISV